MERYMDMEQAIFKLYYYIFYTKWLEMKGRQGP